jgi:hypothetical protein
MASYVLKVRLDGKSSSSVFADHALASDALRRAGLAGAKARLFRDDPGRGLVLLAVRNLPRVKE